MKLKYPLLLPCLLCFGANLYAQGYCIPSVDVNSGDMRITHVKVNGIDRENNLDWEAYVMTDDSTQFMAGEKYPVEIGANIGTFCPEMHIRVYIDFNRDFDFDDAGEETVMFNNTVTGIFTDTIEVPGTIVEGKSRMRIMNKMVEDCGHSAINPCGTDPFVYHGEVEDYNISLKKEEAQDTTATSTQERYNQDLPQVFYSGDDRSLIIQGGLASPVHFTVYDISGREQFQFDLEAEGATQHVKQRVPVSLPGGIYLVSAESKNRVVSTYKVAIY